VITTKGTPWKSISEHNCGWWVDINADSLADAVCEATSLSDAERFEMGKRGRNFVEKTLVGKKLQRICFRCISGFWDMVQSQIAYIWINQARL